MKLMIQDETNEQRWNFIKKIMNKDETNQARWN